MRWIYRLLDWLCDLLGVAITFDGDLMAPSGDEDWWPCGRVHKEKIMDVRERWILQETFRANAAEAEVAKWRELHGDRDRDLTYECARANKAEDEIETVHRYLDECFINDPDEGRAVPLIDRVVRLVSQFARDDAAVARLRDELAEIAS